MAEVLKKSRKSNFSSHEIDVLVNTVSENYETLYGEFSKRAIFKQARHRAWLDVTRSVNRVSTEKRTLQEVKNKWKKCQHLYRAGCAPEILDEFDLLRDNIWEPLTSVIEEGNMKNKTKHSVNKSNRANSLIRHCAVYDPDFKKAVVQYAERKSTREATRRYGISESNIRRWRRLKLDILEKAQRTKRSKNEDVDIIMENDEISSSLDSMPLQQRLKAPIPSTSSDASTEMNEPAVLHSQPLSPTKLKVTRQTAKLPQSSPKPTTPPPPDDENVCLRWSGHHSNMQTTFPNLLLKEQYVDATLVAEGQCLKCHRVILSSCSPYFENVLSCISPLQHPVLFMKDIPYWIMKSICDFMYAGEVRISKSKLDEVVAVAETLKIKGLASNTDGEEHKMEIEPVFKVKEEKKEEITDVKENVKDVREKRRCHQPPPPVDMPVLKSAKLPKSIQQQQNMEMPILKSSRFLRNTHTSRRTEKIETRNERIEKKSERMEKPSKDPPDASGIYDPFNLLEPVYEELTTKSTNAPIKVKESKSVPVKKPVPKKLKKRKVLDDREESPPPVLSRKGTRSRPNRKIPKFYHTPYDRKTKVSELVESTPIVREPHTDQADPLLPVEEIKSEPLDVLEDTIEIEDNVMSFSDHELNLPDEDMFKDFDTPIANIKTNKTEDSKSMDSSEFKKISLLSEPIIMDGSNTVKIVDVADITSSMTTNSILSDDPLNINQSPTRITITNVQSVLEKDDSVSAELGFQISEVISQVDNSKDDNISHCKDLGFQITSIVGASSEDKKGVEGEEMSLGILKHSEIEDSDNKDDQPKEDSLSCVNINSSRVCIEKMEPNDSNIETDCGLAVDEISDQKWDTKSEERVIAQSSLVNVMNETQNGNYDNMILERKKNECDKKYESVCEESEFLPIKPNDNEVEEELALIQNNIISENTISSCEPKNQNTNPQRDKVLTSCKDINNKSSEKAEIQITSNENNCTIFNQNDNIDIPNLPVSSSSIEKLDCYTSQTDMESEDFIQDNIDDMPGFHIEQVIDEQIAINEEKRLTSTSVNELSQMPVDGVHASGSSGLRLETSDLETIVNDLTKIVGDARNEIEVINERNDLTNEIVDSLENILEK